MGKENSNNKDKEQVKQALITIFSNNSQYKKANGLINAKGKATLTALRLFAISTKYAKYNEKEHAAVSEVPINSLKKILGLKGNAMYSIANKATFKGDRNSLLDWRIIVDNGAYNVIQDAFCENGILRVTFNSKLSNQIIDLKNNYTTLSLEESMSIGSIYAFHLYEILKSRLDLLRSKSSKKKGAVTWIVNLTDFKLRMGLVNVNNQELQAELKKDTNNWKRIEEIIINNSLGAYDNSYKKIKARVLSKSVEEVNNKTSLVVSFKEKKVGKSVESLIFILDDDKSKINSTSDYETEINEDISVIDKVSKNEINAIKSNHFDSLIEIAMLLAPQKISKKDVQVIAEVADYDTNKVKKAYEVANSPVEFNVFKYCWFYD